MPLKDWKQRSVSSKVTLAERRKMDWKGETTCKGPWVHISGKAPGSRVQAAEALWRSPSVVLHGELE